MKFIDISERLSVEEYEKIKKFILKNGNRQTYCTYDGNNPHYKFDEFSVFLHSDIGQRNMYNDENISDFNQLTIRASNIDIRHQYYNLVIVRKGDIKKVKTRIQKGMEEEKVYLVDVHKKRLPIVQANLTKFLEIINAKIRKH